MEKQVKKVIKYLETKEKVSEDEVKIMFILCKCVLSKHSLISERALSSDLK